MANLTVASGGDHEDECNDGFLRDRARHMARVWEPLLGENGKDVAEGRDD